MSILQELLSMRAKLVEAPEVPIELSKLFADDISDNFRANALEKLWGGKRIVWHGMQFFNDHELGDAYVKAEEAAEKFINDGYSTEVNIFVDASHLVDAEHARGDIDLNFEVPFGNEDKQECYLGYDPKHDNLYIGYDAHIGEDEFNEEWDSAFEAAIGEEYDSDNEEHAKLFNEAWTQFRDGFMSWGLLFQIDEHFNCEEALPPMAGGFYKSTYNVLKRSLKGVHDLRLD